MRTVSRSSSRILGDREVNMKWITRKDIKVDRLACPWLITRFTGGILVRRGEGSAGEIETRRGDSFRCSEDRSHKTQSSRSPLYLRGNSRRLHNLRSRA